MAREMHRRTFLRQTAIAGTATSLAIRGRTSRGASSAGETVVVGVMGLNRGKDLARTFAEAPGVDIKYVCDVDSDRAAGCAKWLDSAVGKSARPIGDFRRILDDGDVDALVCAAPNHWHAPATILACKAGKHVYVEKPCSHNPREGELMVEAARRYRRAVQMGTQSRSDPVLQRAVEEIRSGVIGPVYLARGWYNNSRRTIGHGQLAEVPPNLDYELWQGPAPRRPYVDNRIPYNWHWFWHWGNGELGNNGVHAMDVCRWALDVPLPVRVTSSGGRYRFDDDQETPDTQTVAFDFEGGKSITWQGLSCNEHGSRYVAFYGYDGAIDVQGAGYKVYDAGNKLMRTEKSSDEGQTPHVANFLAAIRDDQPLRLNSEIGEGHKSTLLSHLGNIAQRSGRTLRCDPESGAILDDQEAMSLWTRDYEPGWEPSVS